MLLINILKGKLIFAVKEIYGIEYQRIGENSLRTWNFRSLNFEFSMQKTEKIFSFASSSKFLGFDCDFDENNEAHTYEEKRVYKKEYSKHLSVFD